MLPCVLLADKKRLPTSGVHTFSITTKGKITGFTNMQATYDSKRAHTLHMLVYFGISDID